MSFVYDLWVDNNLDVKGDLHVQGTTTSVNTDNMNIKDRHIYLNNGYTTVGGKTGGIVVNYLPTATTDTVAAGGFATTTTVITTGSATFAAGDIVQVSVPTPDTYDGEKANLGVFEVLTHIGTTLTIQSSSDFAQTAFVVDVATTGADITKVTVSLMQTSASGAWQTTTGATSTDLTANLKNILLDGSPTSNASLTLTDATNQLVFDPTPGTFDTTISAPEPGQDSVITIPDPGTATANFVLSEGAQTINGQYTIDSAAGSLIFEDTTGDHTYTIGVGELTANSTYSLPALDGAHTFIVENGTTGQILADITDAGVAATPTYSFTADPDTGIYLDSGTSLNVAYGGSDILEIDGSGLTVNGSISSTTAPIEQVKAWTGSATQSIVLTGDGSEPVHTVNFTGAATITLPAVGAAQDGLKYTIISLLDGDAELTIDTADSATFDNGTGTMVFKKTYQRATFQYIQSQTRWHIV